MKKIKKAENESKIHAKNQSKFIMYKYYIEKSSKEQNSLIKYPDTKKIERFQWRKEKEVLNFITLNFDTKESVKNWDIDQISSWSTTSLTQSHIFIAELYYGSYSDLFKIKSDVKEIREQIKSIISTKIRTIIDMIKNLLITYTTAKDYS